MQRRVLPRSLNAAGRYAVLLVALSGCGPAKSGSGSQTDVNPNGGAGTGAGTGSGSGEGAMGGVGNEAGATEPMVEPVVDSYPRTWAPRALSQRLVTGEVNLLGGDPTSCTNGLPTSGERWCAFSRKGQADTTELWVVNITQAMKQAPVPCDGKSPVCLRLTSHLWTGSQLWGPSHPQAQRFEGDTLIFHADALEKVRDPYEGPIYAWRPGWPAARRISTDRGVTCSGHRSSAAVYCIDSLDVEPEREASFFAPVWRSFDLLAGTLEDGSDQPLGRVERIAMPTGKAQAFRAQFTRRADKLAYSSILPGDTRETLRWVSLEPALPFEPKTVLDDAANWELAHDGMAAYVLRGYEEETWLGNLAVVDFPSGENLRPIASDVSHIDLVGAFDDLLSEEDRGLGYGHATAEGETFEFIRDRAKLSEAWTTAVGVHDPLLSADGAYALFFQNAKTGWPLATVARTGQSDACTLNNELGAETYGGGFTDNGEHVVWIEYGSSGSEQGFIADPATCTHRVQFGDWVLGYALTDDFVVFEGGDEADSTSYIQYARLPKNGLPTSITPLVVEEHPRSPFLTLREGAGTYIVYGAAGDDPEGPGLYLHGPLEAGFPAP